MDDSPGSGFFKFRMPLFVTSLDTIRVGPSRHGTNCLSLTA